ncbi:MAG: hypothetical protein K2M90_04270 [Treponemataceae bacterium]|nr:hypothetical protein [Treponemataceae bacterium]
MGRKSGRIRFVSVGRFRFFFRVGQSLRNVERMLLNVERMLLNVEQVLLNVERMLLGVNAVGKGRRVGKNKKSH